MMRKDLLKYIAFALIAVLTVFCIAACEVEEKPNTDTGTQQAVTTVADNETTEAPTEESTTTPTPAETFPETGDRWSNEY